MIKPLFAAALTLALLAAVPAQAEVIAVPGETATARATDVPARGASMAKVQKLYGQPRVRHAAAGGDSPRHPPITRWDYDGFSVFFENSHVVDSVRPDDPPAVVHQDQLTSVR